MARGASLLPLILVFATAASPARAQYVPSTPLVMAGGRVVIGGDVSASVAEEDHEGWFNYTDYEHDALRMFRWSVSGEWRLAGRVSFLGQLRGENTEHPRVYGAYLRARPFARVPLDVQAGRIPPTFGAFGRRLYSTDNPLIGLPLGYQYLLSIRPDAIPRTSDDLLRMRARGWQSSFPVGSSDAIPGVPTVSAYTWDTGVQVRLGTDRAQVAGAITNGSLSAPRFKDDNGGKQLAGRAQFQPLFGLVVGISAARGAWIGRDVQRLTASGQPTPTQRALGLDGEYSRGHWIVRGEAIRSEWTLPGVASAQTRLNVTATTGWLEGSYRLTPQFDAAARADRLTFSRIRGTLFNGAEVGWEAPITRLEVGGGWYLQRNVIARMSVQRNMRDGGRQRERTFVSGQLLFWF
jgi:hypothetical protein